MQRGETTEQKKNAARTQIGRPERQDKYKTAADAAASVVKETLMISFPETGMRKQGPSTNSYANQVGR